MHSLVDNALSMQLKNEYESGCPYYDIFDICNASISLIVLKEKEKINYCKTENYDNCSIFLAKVLRGR